MLFVFRRKEFVREKMMDIENFRILKNGQLKIRYYLSKNDFSEKNDYNIEISCGEETVNLVSVAESYEKAKELFDKLYYGDVTPVTAVDIFEDWKYTK